MASQPKSKNASKTDKDDGSTNKNSTEKETKKDAKKTTEKKDTGAKAEASEEATKKEAPAIKKKRKTAKEIDKSQARRLVKPVRKKSKLKKTRKVAPAVKKEKMTRDIGVEVELPVESCDDPFCPFHGTLSVRGQILKGIVVSSRMDKTSIVQREIKRFIPKYERYEKRTYRYPVHNPPCLNVQRGDLVKIMECRPLSKSKAFVVIEKL
jgi:small subunit ribosomal protein S17